MASVSFDIMSFIKMKKRNQANENFVICGVLNLLKTRKTFIIRCALIEN